MRKFKIRINSKWQTILSENKNEALIIAKENLGYKGTDVLINWTLEFFNGIEDLHERCKKIKEIKGDKRFEIIEHWGKPSKEREYGDSFEIVREDNYFDVICFEWNEDKLADEVYNILKVYNREITPIEKYKASL